MARDLAQRDVPLAVPRGRTDGLARDRGRAVRVVLNALSLRRDGSGVQTYVRELMAALPSACPDETFVARVAASDVPLVPAGVVAKPVRLPFDHGLARRLRSLVPPRAVDLVHGLDTDPPFIDSTASFVRIGATCSVATVHDLALFDVPDAFDARRGRIKRALVGYAIRHADAIIAVSSFTAERVRERFGRNSVVVHEAPSRDFAPAGDAAVRDVVARYSLPERFVLHLANLEPRKDLATIAAACRAADVPLVLGGGAIRTTEVPDGVVALGYVPQADLPALYGAARVVAYVSKYEGFALPPIEAMACGAVVMATPVGALPEVAGDGVETVPVGDVDAQAHALRELFHDEGRRAERRAAAARAVAALSWDRAARETVAVYNSFL